MNDEMKQVVPEFEGEVEIEDLDTTGNAAYTVGTASTLACIA